MFRVFSLFGVGVIHERLLLIIANDRYFVLSFFFSKDSVYGRFHDKLKEKKIVIKTSSMKEKRTNLHRR